MDLCGFKFEMIWKLKVGHLCAEHCSLFLSNGGDPLHLQAIESLLNEVRLVTLGHISKKTETKVGLTEFTIDSLKTHPVVVAASIAILGVGIGWGATYKVWVEPQKEQIKQMRKQVEDKSKASASVK